MVDWGEIERKIRQERQDKNNEDLQRAHEETSRKLAAQKEQREQEELKLAQQQRFEKERENWGSKEKVLATWEKRAKKLVDIANELESELRSESKLAMRRFEDHDFRIYGYRKFGQIFGGFTKEAGTFRINELGYQSDYQGPSNFYVLKLRGNAFKIDDSVSSPPPAGQSVGKRYSDKELLREAIHSIFLPLISADRIKDGNAPIIKSIADFFRYREDISTLPAQSNVGYEAHYENPIPKKTKVAGWPPPTGFAQDEFEDIYISLMWESKGQYSHAIVLNPFYKNNDKFRKTALGEFYLITEH